MERDHSTAEFGYEEDLRRPRFGTRFWAEKSCRLNRSMRLTVGPGRNHSASESNAGISSFGGQTRSQWFRRPHETTGLAELLCVNLVRAAFGAARPAGTQGLCLLRRNRRPSLARMCALFRLKAGSVLFHKRRDRVRVRMILETLLICFHASLNFLGPLLRVGRPLLAQLLRA